MRVLATVSVFLALAVVASAAPVCLPGSLEDYIALVDGCTVGDKWFRNFSFTSDGHSAPQDQHIAVTVLGTAPFLGLQFAAKQASNGWHVFAGGKDQESIINYEVAILSGPDKIYGAILAAQDVQVKGAGTYLQIQKLLCPGAAFSPGCAGLVTISKIFTSDSAYWNDVGGWFPTGYTLVGVREIVTIHTAAGPGNKAAIDGYLANRWAQSPEPAGYVLLGSGLVALGFLRRRMRKR